MQHLCSAFYQWISEYWLGYLNDVDCKAIQKKQAIKTINKPIETKSCMLGDCWISGNEPWKDSKIWKCIFNSKKIPRILPSCGGNWSQVFHFMGNWSNSYDILNWAVSFLTLCLMFKTGLDNLQVTDQIRPTKPLDCLADVGLWWHSAVRGFGCRCFPLPLWRQAMAAAGS